jgi:PAS domain S-box-containing protein
MSPQLRQQFAELAEENARLREERDRLLTEAEEHSKPPRALDESESHCRIFVETAQDSIFSVDEDGVFIYANGNAAREVGLTPESLVGKNMWDIFPDSIADRQMESIRKTFNSKTGYLVFENPTVMRGETRWYSTSIRAHVDAISGKRAALLIARNITHLKQITKALGETESRYHELLEAAGETILSVNRRGQVLFSNSQAARILGYAGQELAGRLFQSLVPPAEIEAAMGKIQTAIDCPVDAPYVYEFESDLPGGKRWFRSTLRAYYDARVGEKAALIIGRDITVQRNAQNALAASEAKYRELVENAKSIILRLDVQGNVVFCNRFALEFFRFDEETLLGRNVVGTIVPDTDRNGLDLHEFIADLCREPGKYGTNENENMRSDGERVWVAWTNNAIRNEDGSLREILCVGNDITEAKRAEREVARLRRQIEFILGATKTGLDIIDEDLNMIYVDPEWQKIYGDYKGRKCHEYFCSYPHACEGCCIPKAIAQNKVMVSEHTLPKEGNRPILVTTIPFVDEEGKRLVAEVNVDLTERKRLEEQLIRSERLAAVGTLAGGVAHEFNNLNVSILGYAELALLSDDISEEMREWLRRIHNASQRAKGITNNLLAFARASKENPAMADLVAVVRDTIDLARREITTSGAELETDLKPVPETLMDAGQIGQVVLNLLINALHAMLGRPEKKLVVRTGEGEGMVFVSVSDTGCGIPKENLPRIFYPFFTTKGEHGGSSPQAAVKGTGLGLSVSNTIIENHKGRIEVYSEVGMGTILTVLLPIRIDLKSEGERLLEGERPAAGGAEILVLDDEKDSRDLISVILRKKNFTVHETSRGSQALSILRKKMIDVVILDLQMPEMTGAQFLEKLGKLPANRRPTPIVVTGLAEGGDLEANLEEIVFAVIVKPFSIDEISDTVEAALLKRREL